MIFVDFVNDFVIVMYSLVDEVMGIDFVEYVVVVIGVFW